MIDAFSLDIISAESYLWLIFCCCHHCSSSFPAKMIRITNLAGRGLAYLHRFLARSAIAYPSLLIPLAILYVAITRGAASISNELGTATAALLFWAGILEPTGHVFLSYQIAQKLFFCLTALIWSYFIFLVFMCFRAATRAQMPAFAVAQLVASTVFIFAGVHYYVALLSDTDAYAGAQLPTPYGDDIDDRLFYFPSLETIVDFVYFSVVTTATVGYGDIYPKTWLARLVTVVQISMSFVLIAVVLAYVLGQPEPPPGSNEPESDG